MIVYGILLAFTLVLYLFLVCVMRYKKRSVDKIVVSFFFISYLILLSLRDISVGVDLPKYIDSFHYFSFLKWNELAGFDQKGNEIGFLILNKILAYTKSDRLFIITFATLAVLPIMYLYVKESEGAFFCISFFTISLLFDLIFSGLRQCVAIALVVPAFYCIKYKKIFLFLFVVALAYTFHYSAVLLLLLYPLQFFRVKNKHLLIIILLFSFAWIYRLFLIDNLFIFLERIDSSYYHMYYYLNGMSSQGMLALLFILLALYSFVVLDEKKANQDDYYFRNIMLLAVFLHLFTVINPTFVRMNYYFILFIPIVITRANNRCHDSFAGLTSFASFIMSSFFLYHFLYSSDNTLQFHNYIFFW